MEAKDYASAILFAIGAWGAIGAFVAMSGTIPRWYTLATLGGISAGGFYGAVKASEFSVWDVIF